MKENGFVVVLIVGLYFMKELFDEIEVKGVELVYLILYVGLGIFCFVSVDKIEEYYMYSEFYCLMEEVVEWLN